jgi:site-specific recombinase
VLKEDHPVAWLISLAWVRATGHPVFSEETAHHIVESLDPFHTFTLPYAAFTGILLWVSSAFASWIENWTVYRRIPEALARSPRLQGWIGEGRSARVGALFSRQISGTMSSIVLGVLLAVTPMLGKFFGLPLDVRHVTLSTGALTFAVSSAPAISHHAVLMAGLGIVFIGILNFGVSFAMSLFFACRARGVSREWALVLGKSVLLRLASRPFEFLFPLNGR